MSEKLKPCPFCGESAASFNWIILDDLTVEYTGYIVCTVCGALGPSREYRDFNMLENHRAEKWEETQWNRRTNSDK